MRLGIPSLLKTGTIDTIRVSKRLPSRLLTGLYISSTTCFLFTDALFRLYALDDMFSCFGGLFLTDVFEIYPGLPFISRFPLVLLMAR